MTTTATHLRTIATLWTDLRDALATPTTPAGFGIGLRGYLATLEEHDLEEARALRALERDPAQIGQRPVPINLHIHDTLHAVEAALIDTADRIARDNQRTPVQPLRPHSGFYATAKEARIAAEDRARRARLAAADAIHPQRWRFTGRRTGPYAALWLCARVHGITWPGRALTEQQHQHVASVAAGALLRMETALDLADQRRELTAQHPCQCGGTIEVYGGAGAAPVARCKGCGALWTERGIIASRGAVAAA
ncbi:hypothetical protein [Streptomyces marianii]|uniref:Uncharacterized protein n=1 Tax=Streptomyces marianii TaxID=1817406 RepID=A0A5R9E0M7_9ACTN|nr:hypothetical protein [Streptomyces marianii]TLQ43468.1 hypothetical protein FEF34_10210 [Streptomyces marianii]